MGSTHSRRPYPVLQLEPLKSAGLSHQNLDVDAWARFALDHKRAWKVLLAKWRYSLSPVDTSDSMLNCSLCCKSVHKQGLGFHMPSVRSHFRIARLSCDKDGRCPVCNECFPSRLRCMHHVHYSDRACLQALTGGHVVPLSMERVSALDVLDAAVRRQASRTRQYYLAW